jgi:methyl-accepting chemotaxis protein
MQSLLDACWKTLSQAQFRLVWTIPFVLAICGLFFWVTRKAALRPLSGRIDRLERSAGRARETAASLADTERTVAQELRDQLPRIDNAAGDAADIATMARQTASAADELAGLAQQSRKTAERSTAALSEVIAAMEQTRGGFAETTKLVAMLDEVAVQTNLLALGAAVEASRVGSAGASEVFAHIAEELHDVAIRSGEAARVAEQAVARILRQSRSGEQVAAGLRSGIVEVEGASARIARLSHEVAAAEKEKAGELSRLSQSLATINKALEHTTAGAAAAAAMSDEISAQTGRVVTFSRQLAEQVGRTPVLPKAERSEEASANCAPVPVLAQ